MLSLFEKFGRHHAVGLFLLLTTQLVNSFSMNATGGTFPNLLMQETTFAYEFSGLNTIDYFDGGTITGKCNIMGYWHIGNTNPAAPNAPPAVRTLDTEICTDVCTIASCGYDSTKSPRVDHVTRFPRSAPLVDFAISEMPFTSADYQYYPDLQTFPAFAGAVVPVFNIKPLGKNPLVLSRSTLTQIFLGKIRHWNDSRILHDNLNTSAYHVLASLNESVNVVVRQDSSGISMIFAQALSSFDPATGHSLDSSFGGSVGRGPVGKPAWCDLLTDEVQIIAVDGCDGQLIVMEVVVAGFNKKTLQWLCNASASELQKDFLDQLSTTVIVHKTPLSSTSWSYQVGYWDAHLAETNWYQPMLISSGGVNVSVSTLQEGGMWNIHYSVSNYYITPEVQSLFVSVSSTTPQQAFFFSFTCLGLSGSHQATTAMIDSQTSGLQLASAIEGAINAMCFNPASVSLVTTSRPGSSWVEYQITFRSASEHVVLDVTSHFKQSGSSASSAIFLTTLLSPRNFPHFKDPAYKGVQSGQRYTCYKRSLNYVPFSYNTAQLATLNAVVKAIPFSIGYSTLTDANTYSLSIASLVNKAGVTVTASSDSISFAVMEKGGDLDQNLNAVIVDGSSHQSWPICGYNYFLVRLKAHIGTCAQRQTAMNFLYTFYDDDIIKAVANQLGLALVPDFIRNRIRQEMVEIIKCSDGSLALEAYALRPTLISVTAAFAQTVKSYLTSYANINSQVQWNTSTAFHSTVLTDGFSQYPDSYVGMFSMLSSREAKLSYLSDSRFLTNAFAHVPLAVLYRLDSLSAGSTTGALRVTPAILAGIFAGTIVYWNDTLIQNANIENKVHLPFEAIKVVVRTVPSDTNSIFLRYLSMVSETFVASYPAAKGTDYRTVNFASRIVPHNLVDAKTANEIDASVTYFDGSIGYFMYDSVPMSQIAGLCLDRAGTCDGYNRKEGINPAVFPNDGGAAVEACTKDRSTIISAENLHSYDLMTSKAAGCYPIVGTADWTVFQGESKSCPSASPTAQTSANAAKFDSTVQTRIKLSQWLYNGESIVRPLIIDSIVPTHKEQRTVAHKELCNIECSHVALGYDYCGYTTCGPNDYDQLVSNCNAETATRKVSYRLKNGSTCIVASAYSSVKISCPYTPLFSPIGIFLMFLIISGVILCLIVLGLTLCHKYEKAMKRSQLVFVFFFIIGAIALVLTIADFWGPASDVLCLLRPWLFGLTASLMFAPLAMKLHRVDTIFNNPTLKRMRVTNWQVGRQVLLVMCGDVTILVLWTVLERPTAIDVHNTYSSVLFPVADRVCNTGLNSRFELVMIGYKSLMLLFAISKAVRTWSIPSDISEAKQFAIAIYNITIIGGIGYFVGALLGVSDVSLGNALRSIGIWAGACVSVLVIMVPKLLEVEAIAKRVKYSQLKEFVFSFWCIKAAGGGKYTAPSKVHVTPIDGCSSTTSAGIAQSSVNDPVSIGSISAHSESSTASFRACYGDRLLSTSETITTTMPMEGNKNTFRKLPTIPDVSARWEVQRGDPQGDAVIDMTADTIRSIGDQDKNQESDSRLFTTSKKALELCEKIAEV